ncbi:Rrp15p-domain-containing protein [Lipomyces kononenkoae]|uniref:Rrp15p-domain-containing protein n=1 Tax=Lipomyces kononenkoae TaxID=34357 RepID=A0ACC3T5M2_LIPKO
MPGPTTLDGKKRKSYRVSPAKQKGPRSSTASSNVRSKKTLPQAEDNSHSNKKRKIVEDDASSNDEDYGSFDELSENELSENELLAQSDSNSDGFSGSDSNDDGDFVGDNGEEGTAKGDGEHSVDDAQGDDEEDEESASDGDEEIEDINNAALEKRTKKKKRTDPEAFSSAMTAILSSHLKAHDRKDPVLVRSKKTAKAIEESKLEAKARRELRLEKKGFLDRERIKDVITGVREGDEPNPDAVRKTTERERMLKKTAKRGVVKLFNTVIEAQKKATDALSV